MTSLWEASSILTVSPHKAKTEGLQRDQNDWGGTFGKEHNGWSFDEDDNNTNAWGDSFSAWD